MKEITLYRKYRPKTWEEVLGQEHITSALKGQIKSGKTSHAYLFSGSRGTGKTSIARIFANTLGTEERDIYEIDAASNRKIEHIRELRQSLHVLPFSSPQKVYIIDEVHMLTTEAFNALLKSLEEPPAHVVFILATTEPHKIPETIRSRCEMYDFKKPTQVVLKKLVTDLAKKEGKDIDTGAATLISILGNGAFRDTLGALQKVLYASGDTKQITQQTVSEITGVPNAELVNRFVVSVNDGDVSASLKVLADMRENNMNTSVFLELVILKFRAILLLRFAEDGEGMVRDDLTEDELTALKDLAKKPNSHINSRTLSECLLAHQQMKDAFIKELPLELAIIRLFGQNGQE